MAGLTNFDCFEIGQSIHDKFGGRSGTGGGPSLSAFEGLRRTQGQQLAPEQEVRCMHQVEAAKGNNNDAHLGSSIMGGVVIVIQQKVCCWLP